MPGGAIDSTGVNVFTIDDIKNQLPEEKAEKVVHLYRILGRIERMGVLPYFYAFVSAFILIVPAMMLLRSLSGRVAEILSGTLIGMVMVGLILLTLGVVVFQLIYYRPHFRRKVKELKDFISSDYHFPETLETLKSFNSEVVEKTQRFIPKIVAH